MKTTLISLLFILFWGYSCTSIKTKQLRKEVIGEWKYVRTDDYRQGKYQYKLKNQFTTLGNDISGLTFYNNNICENKIGFYKSNLKKDKVVIYLGNKTKYKIAKSHLKILDISNNIWESIGLFSIEKDTMIFKISDSCFSKYSKVNADLNPDENYDKIIVSTSTCFGTCPSSNVSIDKSGEVLFLGDCYNTHNGFFSAKITTDEFKKIETSFKKADILSLKDNYSATRSDDETVSILFIKENKIVKSIIDYGRESPNELIWAYTPVRYLYQKLKLTPIKADKPNLTVYGIKFSSGKLICVLSKAESFFLLNEIYKGKKDNSNFELKYNIEYWNSQGKRDTINSDGQFYKIGNETIDIGYNFLSENNLSKKFRLKKEYER